MRQGLERYQTNPIIQHPVTFAYRELFDAVILVISTQVNA